jgi:tellurite resistance protein
MPTDMGSASLSTVRYSDEHLDGLRHVGDAALDPIMRELVDGKSLAAVNAVLRTAVSNRTTASEGLPPRLAAWLDETARLPSDVDRHRLDRASEFFFDHAVSISALLGLASLPECYAARSGVKALHATDQMGYSGTAKRVSETAQFVLHVMCPGSFRDDGAAIPALVKVRMMHAASRLLIGAEQWDAAVDGVPVNQEDLIGTLGTFGCTPLRHLEKIGVHPTPEQREDFWYFWRIAGEMLGIDRDAMPVDFAECEHFMQRIRERHYAKSNEGIELTKSLLAFYTSIVPGAGLLEGLVPGIVRYLAGDEVSDILEVPPSGYKAVIERNRVVLRWLNVAQERSSVVNRLVNGLGVKLLEHEAIRMGEGRRASFSIPDSIRRAWRLPPHGSGPAAAIVLCELATEISRVASDKGREAVVDVAVLVAHADGEIDDLEEAAIVVLLEKLGLPSAPVTIRKRARRASSKSHDERVKEAARALSEADVSRLGLSFAIALAYANSGIAKEERSTIEALAEALGHGGPAVGALVEETRARIARAMDAPSS